VSLFENKTLPEFLELFQREFPLAETEIELILTENKKTDTFLNTNLKAIEHRIGESIERAHQTGYIELNNLVWVMAFDDSYDEIILQLLKKYQCDKRLPEELNRHDMWTHLLRRWSRVGFDKLSVMPRKRGSLPAIQLIPHYQYKTGTFIKKEPEFFDDYYRSGLSYIKLEEFKEYLTSCIKIGLPAAIFPNDDEAKDQRNASIDCTITEQDSSILLHGTAAQRLYDRMVKYLKNHNKTLTMSTINDRQVAAVSEFDANPDNFIPISREQINIPSPYEANEKYRRKMIGSIIMSANIPGVEYSYQDLYSRFKRLKPSK
jgi:hypothetical protein